MVFRFLRGSESFIGVPLPQSKDLFQNHSRTSVLNIVRDFLLPLKKQQTAIVLDLILEYQDYFLSFGSKGHTWGSSGLYWHDSIDVIAEVRLWITGTSLTIHVLLTDKFIFLCLQCMGQHVQNIWVDESEFPQA